MVAGPLSGAEQGFPPPTPSYWPPDPLSLIAFLRGTEFRLGIGDVFGQFARRAKQEGWRYFEIDASHNPHITNPQGLLAILQEIAGN